MLGYYISTQLHTTLHAQKLFSRSAQTAVGPNAAKRLLQHPRLCAAAAVVSGCQRRETAGDLSSFLYAEPHVVGCKSCRLASAAVIDDLWNQGDCSPINVVRSVSASRGRLETTTQRRHDATSRDSRSLFAQLCLIHYIACIRDHPRSPPSQIDEQECLLLGRVEQKCSNAHSDVKCQYVDPFHSNLHPLSMGAFNEFSVHPSTCLSVRSVSSVFYSRS